MILLIMACLASQPAECRVHQVPLDTSRPVLPAECYRATGEWAVQHPQWIVKRFGCPRVREVGA